MKVYNDSNKCYITVELTKNDYNHSFFPLLRDIIEGEMLGRITEKGYRIKYDDEYRKRLLNLKENMDNKKIEQRNLFGE